MKGDYYIQTVRLKIVGNNTRFLTNLKKDM